MIDIDPSSPVPLYLQISEQITRLIAIGALLPQERLPTVRELAVQARVNRNTAARAVQHLESSGLVRTRVGKGTFVEASKEQSGGTHGRDEIDRRIERMLVDAHTLGVPLEEVGRRVEEKIRSFRETRDTVPARPVRGKNEDPQ